MFYFSSGNTKFTEEIRASLLERGLFFYCIGTNITTTNNLIIKYEPKLILIDAVTDRKRAIRICEILKNLFPHAILLPIIKTTPRDDSLFKYVPAGTYEIQHNLPNETAEAVFDYICRVLPRPQNSFGHLYLGENRHQASLLKFPLKLTKSEYKIISLLCQNPNNSFDADMILNMCFLNSELKKKGNVYSHIFSINRKAIKIGNRRLIINKKGVGYSLNPNM